MNKHKFDSLPDKGKRLARRLIAEYGTIANASRQLGIRRATLYRKMERGENVVF